MTTSNNSDRLTLIQTVEDLHYYLIQGMKIEHATLPPYLTALYSLKPGSNIEAFQILRSVAVEEMLHLTLAANVFNAVGGNIQSILTAEDFIPEYPAFLPTGERDFKVGLEKFSPETVKTFLQIERVDEIPEGKPLVMSRKTQKYLISIKGRDDSYSFYSIGQFYAEIIRGLFALSNELGEDTLFGKNDPQEWEKRQKKQISREYYYDGAGDIIPVKNLNDAIRALHIIQLQGEGSTNRQIFDSERELAHYYRFQQLELGRYYKIDKDNPENSDKPDHPTGVALNQEDLDWDAVYPIKSNAKLSDYPEDCELYHVAKDFKQKYKGFLGWIEHAFNGHPEQLIPAVGGMFKLKYQAEKLVKNPIPGLYDEHGAPIHGAPIF